GHRVEPAEIETILAACPGVAQVAVVARGQGAAGKQLAAYLTATPGTTLAEDQIAEWAAERLPDYMIPAAVVILDALPLTGHGKVDRAALPAPDYAARTGHQAPATPREELLCALFADLLGLEAVGAADGFFDLGGDSIMSMQLAVRARRAGLGFTPQDVFEHETPAALAAIAVAADTPELAPEGPAEVPLTPVMRAVATQPDGMRVLAGRFAQWMAVRVPPDLDVAALEGAVAAVVRHHPILASRLAGEGAAARLIIPTAADTPDAGGQWVRRADAAGLDPAALEEAAVRAAQETSGRLDPTAGVMIQAAWLDAGPTDGRLVVVAHHLVVDGVSWRILLPDLAAAYHAAVTGTGVGLDRSPMSFAVWAGLLAGQDRSAEQPAWAELLGYAPEPPLGDRPLDAAADRFESVLRVSAELDPRITAELMTRVPGLFHCGPDDVLLAGLVAALAAWRGSRGQDATSVLIDVESHGRQPFAPGMDLSRAVGWFTSIHPVRLGTGPASLAEVRDGGAAAGVLLKTVKEQARAVPGDGLGYGLLRYEPDGDALAGRPQAQVGFNYLGRFSTGSAESSSVPYWAAVNGLGTDFDPNLPVAHALEVGALVQETPDGLALRLSVAWPGGLLAEQAAQDLAAEWAAMLSGLAVHAASPAAGGHTPSDFPLLSLTQGQVSEVEAAAGAVAEVWPVAPLAEGLLFHAGFGDEGPDVYVGQRVLEISGPVDVDRFRASWEMLLARHAALRGRFIQLAGAAPVQVIPREVVLPWQVAHLSGLADDQAEARATELTATARQERFDLSCPPLLRLLLIKLGEHRYRMVLTSHHVLMDGWSMPVLLGELAALYADDGDGSALPPVVPYRNYLEWLAGQDQDAARAAWVAELAGVEEPTLAAPADPAREAVLTERVVTTAGPELAGTLRAVGRAYGLTVNTLVQGAWALVLSRLAGRSDVVFGATVAGRPAELAGVESMVGLFINTVPVRVRLDPAQPVAGLLAGLQERQAALIGAQHLGLAEIQRIAGPGAVFDTLLVFENYPRPPVPRSEISIRLAETKEAAHYPLTLAALLTEQLELRLDYRPDLFTKAQASTLLERVSGVLAQIAADPQVLVGRVAVTGADERDLVVRAWNDTGP
ncbi:MAG TPA: condensation domain-containing protein, partial [Streptosporangiaceae bacterium]